MTRLKKLGLINGKNICIQQISEQMIIKAIERAQSRSREKKKERSDIASTNIYMLVKSVLKDIEANKKFKKIKLVPLSGPQY